MACQSLGPIKNGGLVVGIDLKVSFSCTFISVQFSSFMSVFQYFRLHIWVCENVEYAEQKVKVPAMHCDSRVQTICADVMKLPKTSVRELSPQVYFSLNQQL